MTKTDAGAKAAGGKKRPEHVNAGEAFGRFWAAYPKRVARKAAVKAFTQAVEDGADVEALVAGAGRYALERAEEDPRYTAYPGNWLAAGRWADEPCGSLIDEDGAEIPFRSQFRRRGERTNIEARAAALLAPGYGEMLWEAGYARR